MSNILRLPVRGSLERMIDSQFNSFIDQFFNNSFPTSLVSQNTYPVYNMRKLTYKEDENPQDHKDGFILEMALAGWTKDEFEVFTKEGVLYIRSKTDENKVEEENNTEYYYQGIRKRSFSWNLSLPKYAVIKDTSFINGLLSIRVEVEVPEEQKIKYIDIK